MTLYSPYQIAGALAQAGFPDSEIPTGVAIAMAESGGDSNATGTAGPGEYSVGPFQINLGEGGHSASINEAQGRDLQGAANYAYQLWAGRGGNFGDWSTYNNGDYQQYLDTGDRRGILDAAEHLMGQPPVPGDNGTTNSNSPWAIKTIEPAGYGKIKVTYANGQQELQSVSGAAERGPTITGARQPGDRYAAQAPDWYNAGQLMLRQYEDAVASGSIPHDKALADYQTALDRAKAQNADISARQIAEAGRQVNLAQEAGNRAQTVARDILPNALPNMQALNLPMIGRVPLSQVNTDSFFNQGLPPLAQTQGIPQTPATPYPEMNLPPVTMPQMPNMGPYAQGAAAGFPGYQVPGFPGYNWG